MTPLILIVFLIFAAAIMYIQKNTRSIFSVALCSVIVVSVLTVYMVFPAFRGVSLSWYGGFWYVDRLAALIALLIAGVSVTATMVSVRYIGHEYQERILSLGQVRLYFLLLLLFILSMLVTVLADNAIIMWMTLEATTLATTMLVALYKKDGSVEAAWKYIILCSTGISLGLVGVLMVNYAATLSLGIHDASIFSLSYLRLHAGNMSPDIIKWGFVFIFVGFGTKVGFVPMHTWLPDAHGKTPSPISAMLSGVLLNVAFYAIIRFKTITDGALHAPDWTQKFFLVFGFLSIVVPAFIMLVQKNYKRMLAYSSVEHMGLTAFAFGLGPIGMMAGLMHMVGHTLTKSALFFAAGEILLKYKTTKIEKVRHLLKQSPITAVLFLIGILAIIAAPPSILFASEYMTFRIGFTLHPWLSVCIGIALTMIAVGMLRPTISMLFGNTTSESVLEKPVREAWNITHTVIVCQFILIVGIGMWFMTEPGMLFISDIATSVVKGSK